MVYSSVFFTRRRSDYPGESYERKTDEMSKNLNKVTELFYISILFDIIVSASDRARVRLQLIFGNATM